MQIFFKDFSKKKHPIDVESSDSIEIVKEKLGSVLDIEASRFKLVYSGRVLQDGKTVEDFKLKDGDQVIYMVSKAKAKPAPAPAPVVTVPETLTTEPRTSSSAEPSSSSVPTNTSTTVNPATSNEEPSTGIRTGDFTAGSQREQVISNIMEMGYERPAVEEALIAAFNNPDRAVDYLLNGIPESARRSQQQQIPTPVQLPNSTPQTNTPAAESTTEETTGDNLFEQAAAQHSTGASARPTGGQSEQLSRLRELIAEDPTMIDSVLTQLSASNPEFARLIQEDPERFAQMILSEENAEDTEMTGAADEENVVRINLTQEDENAINRLCELGFDRDTVIQIYFACDKDEEAAANLLFRD